MLQRIIPSSGEVLPAIGLGTWQTFDVEDRSDYPPLHNVLREMFTAGGRLIDSSPMYGRSEEVIGDITADMPERENFFYATKVWTTGLQQGIRQIEASFRKMQRTCIDLIQIHNLTDWQTHLPQLRKLRDQGKIRYVGITHYTNDSHETLERLLRKEQMDFVQFNYSINDRQSEKRLLPACADLGVASLINRPFGQGNLFKKVHTKPLPPWAAEQDIYSWAGYFSKYLLAHPAVTCIIPATGNPVHCREVMQGGEGVIPDRAVRERMLNYWLSL